MVHKITNNDLGEARSAGLAVVDFSATWCGPCQRMAPVMESISEKLEGQAAVYNADCDENGDLAAEFGIMSIPAIVVLKNGVKAGISVGAKREDELLEFIRKYM